MYISQLGFVQCFFMIELRLCIFGRNFAEVMLCSQCISTRRFGPITIDVNFFLFFNLFLAALGLRCCAWAFSSCGEQGLLFFLI